MFASDSIVIKTKDTIFKTRTKYVELIVPDFVLDSTLIQPSRIDTVFVEKENVSTKVEITEKGDSIIYRIRTVVQRDTVKEFVEIVDTVFIEKEVTKTEITELKPRRWKWLTPALIGALGVSLFALFLFIRRKQKQQ